jgi:penicillin amidase
MIVELGPKPKAMGIYPGGQSGNPSSPFYDNFVETWRTGQQKMLQFKL